MRYEILLKSNLRVLLGQFTAATGMSSAVCGLVVAADRAFFGRLEASGLKVRTYDSVAARFSALWPAHAPWPVDVPRPEPAEIDAKTLEVIREHERRRVGLDDRIASNWPADVPWPAHLPRSTEQTPAA